MVYTLYMVCVKCVQIERAGAARSPRIRSKLEPNGLRLTDRLTVLSAAAKNRVADPGGGDPDPSSKEKIGSDRQEKLHTNLNLKRKPGSVSGLIELKLIF